MASLFDWPFPGTMTALTCIGCLEQLAADTSTKITAWADWHPAHEAVGRGNRSAPDTERPHQGKANVMLFPSAQAEPSSDSPIECRERLGGRLKYYYREAA
jgi:hypothetical protein